MVILRGKMDEGREGCFRTKQLFRFTWKSLTFYCLSHAATVAVFSTLFQGGAGDSRSIPGEFSRNSELTSIARFQSVTSYC